MVLKKKFGCSLVFDGGWWLLSLPKMTQLWGVADGDTSLLESECGIIVCAIVQKVHRNVESEHRNFCANSIFGKKIE